MRGQMNTRYALVASLTPKLADALLPDNYRLLGTTDDGTKSVIAGVDNPCWGLDTDVLPRLAAADRDGREIGEAEATSILSI
jgi:hypothetical protein